MRRFWIPKIIVAVIGFVLLGGFVVMSLWNWLIPGIFGLGAISFVQALGLLVLSKILFGGFRGGHWGGSSEGGRNFWKYKMAMRWNKMTSDERDEFKQKMQNRWGRCDERREEKVGE